MRWIARKLSRLRSVRRAIAHRDGSKARREANKRLTVGTSLIILGLVLGWPAVGALGAVALLTGQHIFITVVAPSVYVFSWIVYGAGFVVGGPSAMRYVADLNAWLARRFVERFLPPDELTALVAEVDLTVDQPLDAGLDGDVDHVEGEPVGDGAVEDR